LNIIIKMKKGQIETMGLVIIVILLVLIAIFSLSFLIKPEQENEDILKLKANSLRSSILKITLCEDVNVKDEIENCLDGYYQCINCDELKTEIIKMIEGSLENEKYDFIVDGFMERKNCGSKVTAVSQELRNGNVEVAICRG